MDQTGADGGSMARVFIQAGSGFGGLLVRTNLCGTTRVVVRSKASGLQQQWVEEGKDRFEVKRAPGRAPR